LNRLGKIGCLLTVCGSIVIVIHAPKESEVKSLLDFAFKVGDTGRQMNVAHRLSIVDSRTMMILVFYLQNFFSFLF
jgi:Magnesium transporter NIPA